MQCEVRVVVRIRVQGILPAILHERLLTFEPLDLLGRVLVTPGRRLVMIKLGKRRPEVPVPHFPDPQAQVDVVEGNAQSFIQPRSEEQTSELQSLMRISYAV